MSVTVKENKIQYNKTETLYYNVRVFCPPEENIKKADFRSTRVETIIEDPENWNISVVRFSVPTNYPLFIWQEDPTTYQVELKYNTSSVTKNLIYTDLCPDCYYPRGIYNSHTVLDILNSSLAEALADLKLLEPTMPSVAGGKIFFYFEPETQLFSFFLEKSLSSDPLFQLRMNRKLYLQFFSTFESIGDFTSTTNLPIQLLTEDRVLNTVQIGAVSYLKITQDVSTLENWNQFSLLSFETSMPVMGELESSSKGITKQVLTDFSLVGTTNRGYVNFFPQGPIREYNLNSKYPLTQVDIQCYVIYSSGEQFPLYLNSGDHLSLKLQFTRKSVFDQ